MQGRGQQIELHLQLWTLKTEGHTRTDTAEGMTAVFLADFNVTFSACLLGFMFLKNIMLS